MGLIFTSHLVPHSLMAYLFCKKPCNKGSKFDNPTSTPFQQLSFSAHGLPTYNLYYRCYIWVEEGLKRLWGLYRLYTLRTPSYDYINYWVVWLYCNVAYGLYDVMAYGLYGHGLIGPIGYGLGLWVFGLEI